MFLYVKYCPGGGMVYTVVLEATAERHGGSSPLLGTNYRRVEESSRPRQSHKLEIAGANPASATNQFPDSTEVVALRC